MRVVPKLAHAAGIGFCRPAGARQACGRREGDSSSRLASSERRSGRPGKRHSTSALAKHCSNPIGNAVFGHVPVASGDDSGPTENSRRKIKNPLARLGSRAYIPPSRRPQLVYRGPRNGPEEASVVSFVSLSVVLWIAEKSSKKTVDGKSARGLYPAPHADGAAGNGPIGSGG